MTREEHELEAARFAVAFTMAELEQLEKQLDAAKKRANTAIARETEAVYALRAALTKGQ